VLVLHTEEDRHIVEDHQLEEEDPSVVRDAQEDIQRRQY
jgi:hypothetical protein